MPGLKVSRGQMALRAVLILFAIFCFAPVLLVLIVSISSEYSVKQKGFSFVPMGFSLDGYRYVFKFGSSIAQAYLITLYETGCGTLMTLLLTSLFAYSISRKDFVLRGPLSIFLLITMLFNGGMIGSYLINVNLWHMRNNLLVLILPGAVTAMNVIIMRTFISSNVPDAIIEAAKIDGASEYFLFFKVVIPIMVPVLASVGFLSAIGHWNEWQTAFLYIDNPKYATLQLVLINIENNLNYLRENVQYLSETEMLALKDAPDETSRMAMLLCTLGPVMVAYPFFQRYFLQGLTIGAVKG